MKLRVKDEIPNNQVFLGQKLYKSHETIFGEMKEAREYQSLQID